MTFAIFIFLFLALLLTGLNLLPEAQPISENIQAGLEMIIGYMMAWNFLIPINELLICVGIIITIEFSIWFWKALKWVFNIIRGTGTN